MASEKKKKKDTAVWDAFVMVFQFGINMIVPIVMCMAIGIWIGNKTGAGWVTDPFFFIGARAGWVNVYKMSKRFMKPTEKRKGREDVKKNQ